MTVSDLQQSLDELSGRVQHSASKTHRITFTGTASEYFRIWIVNLLLTIITLGIYSAWAKVRRLRYFYGNTFLAENNFEYHATPKSILIGRLIVLGVLIVYNVLVTLSPFFAILIIPYLIAIPWVINKALQFTARMTSYRNIRFGFKGSYGRSFLVFVLMPLVSVFSLGLLHPYTSRMTANYLGSNTSWGSANFETDAPVGKFYRILMWMLLPILVLIALFVGLYFLAISSPADLAFFLGDGMVVIVIITYIILIVAFLSYSAAARNVAYNATVLMGPAERDTTSSVPLFQLNSDVSPLRYVWILISNLLVMIVTIGLMRAWAAVRTWRYLADHTSVIGNSSFDNIVSVVEPAGSVASAEYLDVGGIDFGL